MADEHWGRYKTIMVAIGIAIVGHVILVISAIPQVIVHPGGSIACFSIGLVIMGVGVGGFKANISPLIAEQYSQTKMRVETLPTGERVISDPTLTVSRIYMYFYMLINVGVCVAPFPDSSSTANKVSLLLVPWRWYTPRSMSVSGCRTLYRLFFSFSAR